MNLIFKKRIEGVFIFNRLNYLIAELFEKQTVNEETVTRS